MSEKEYLVTEADLLGSGELCEHCVCNDETMDARFALSYGLPFELAGVKYVPERTCKPIRKGTSISCAACGSELHDPYRFCGGCGAKVVDGNG